MRARRGLTMDYSFIYDPKKPESIESYAKKMIGKSFKQIDEESVFDLYIKSPGFENERRKGGVGNLVEERFFGYRMNSDSEPDFKEAGVELKVTPYEVKQDGRKSAGERLVLTMISYKDPVEFDIYKSHYWHKCHLILLVYYLRDRKKESNLDYRIDYVKLFTPPPDDMAIIEQDYRKIVNKICAGKADELSESDTMYLGACTKGATAAKSFAIQYYPPNTPARRRAFCYKTSYMTYVLNKYIIGDVDTYERIVQNVDSLEHQSFEELITEKINIHAGKTDKELCEQFNREYNNNKAQWIDLAYRMLGIKSNKAEEFIKANIVVKAVRIEENGSMVESSPLPQIEFKKMAEENWEDSELHDYFEETKFFFVVFKRSGNQYILQGCKLWNMPNSDLNITVKEGWQHIKDIVVDGIKFEKKDTAKGIVIKNNLPAKSDNRIIHIRPHAQKSFYRLKDGYNVGNNSYDGDELPDGQWMTKQSFWLNNSYVIEQLQDIITKS